MALQGSGQIKLSEIQTEFGGSNPIGLSEYYGKGNAPASGEIQIGADFYGTSNAPVVSRTQFGFYTDNSSGTSNTYSNIPLGSDSTGRYTVITFTGGAANSVSASLGGISMTVVSRADYVNRCFSAIFYCDSSSLGTSANLTVNCNRIGYSCVTVYSAQNISGTTSHTYANGSSSNLSTTFTAANNTFIVAATAGDEYVWSYITGLANSFGGKVGGAVGTSAAWELKTSGGSVTVTQPQNASGSGGPGGYERTLSVASFN